MTNNSILLLFAIVNVVVTGLFAVAVLRQYLRRKRVSQLYWSIALIMAFLATLSYVLMVIVGPTSSIGVALFRIYYIFGAALVPAWLGLGSIALVASQRITRICLIILCALSIVAILLISTATINMSKLSLIAGTPGTGILEPGAWLVTIIILNTLGVLAVVGVALYSGWKLISPAIECCRYSDNQSFVGQCADSRGRSTGMLPLEASLAFLDYKAASGLSRPLVGQYSSQVCSLQATVQLQPGKQVQKKLKCLCRACASSKSRLSKPVLPIATTRHYCDNTSQDLVQEVNFWIRK